MCLHCYDNQDLYGWCDLIGKEWHMFSKDPLDDATRAQFLDMMTYRLNHQAILNINSPSPDFQSALVNLYPPYAISYKSILSNVGEVIKGRRMVDPQHYSAFDLIPRIIMILHAKESNELISKMAVRPSNIIDRNCACSQ